MATYSLAGSSAADPEGPGAPLFDGEEESGVGETTRLPDEPKMPVKPKDCFAYVQQNPCERWPFVMYWAVAIYGLIMVIIFGLDVRQGKDVTSNVIILGIVALLVYSWAIYNFRLALALREQVNEFARKNAAFKKENASLSHEVDSLARANGQLRESASHLKESNRKMEENVKKFTTLQHNLEKFTGGNIAGMEKFKTQCDKMGETWKQTLIKNQKSLFMRIFDQMEMKDDEADMTQEEYNGLLDMLPEDYRQLFHDLGKDWEQLAGDDGIMQFEEFKDIVDEIVEARVEKQMEEE